MTNSTSSEKPPAPHTHTSLGRWVGHQINALMFGGTVGSGERITGYLKNGAKATAVLASLRSCAGKPIGSVPEALEWTIAGLPIPENDIHSDAPTIEEWAAYTALTLYALHQRSLHTDSMHKEGIGFGTAIGQLASNNPNEAGIYRRFSALQTADNKEEVVRHARSLIQLLHAKHIAFDYAIFTEDLVTLENPYRRNHIRLRWGREYFRALHSA